MKFFKIILLLCTAGLLLQGCDKDEQSNTAENQKIKITVGTSAAPSPFTTVNENGELTGYDIDVVKAIFAHLPKYELNFEITEFPSVLAGLDSGRYQIGANNFAMNEKRKEKYFYSAPIFVNQYAISVLSSNNEINSFDDLRGKSTEMMPGLNYATALENYNLEHADNPVKIHYSEADIPFLLQNVVSGRSDFQLMDLPMLELFIKKYQLDLRNIKLTKEESQRIGSPYSYLLVAKSPIGEQLTHDINEGIKKIIANGELAKISHRYFNADYSPK